MIYSKTNELQQAQGNRWNALTMEFESFGQYRSSLSVFKITIGRCSVVTSRLAFVSGGQMRLFSQGKLKSLCIAQRQPLYSFSAEINSARYPDGRWMSKIKPVVALRVNTWEQKKFAFVYGWLSDPLYQLRNELSQISIN